MKSPILLASPLTLTVLLPLHLKMSESCVSMCVREQHRSHRDTWMAVTMTGSTRRESTDTDITRPRMTALYTHTDAHTHARTHAGRQAGRQANVMFRHTQTKLHWDTVT